MDSQINLAAIDPSGAVEEAREAAIAGLDSGDTRLSFLRKGALAGGAALSGGAVLGALTAAPALAAGGGRPPKSFGKGDIGILNYALTLEYLESEFYNEAQANLLSSADTQTKQFINTTQKDEAAHVAALKAALKSKAAKKPTFNFGKATTDMATFKATAFVLENTGVHAYSGQAFNVKSPKVLASALAIVTIEARHAGAIAVITGMQITPNGPFDTPYTAAKVLAAVKGTGFITG